MLSSAEKTALRSIQADLFETRANHAHELERNAEASRILGDAVRIIATEADASAKARALCRIIDEAIAALARRRE